MDPELEDLEEDLPLADELDEDPSAEADDADEALADDPGEAQPQRQPGRRERAVVAAKRERDEARRRADDLQRQLDDVGRRNTGETQAERERREREAYALMSSEERAEYDRNRQAQEIANLRTQNQILYGDLADQRAFDRAVARDARLAKYADKAEEELARQRRAGQNPSRLNIAKVLLADDILSRAPKAAKAQKAQAQQRVAEQRTRPPAGGSDARGGSGRGAGLTDRQKERAARMERLKTAVW